MLNLFAPAKINLTLEVLAERPDGYHDIRSVAQTVSLNDEIIFRPSAAISYHSDSPAWDATKSLVSRTVALLRQETGYTGGVAISMHKRVPLVAGLGGDSSDAATTLRGLDRLWQLGLSDFKMHQLAARLGADVAFFLKGGTALLEGRGEIVTSLPPLARTWLVLMVPSIPRPANKTASLYARLRPEHCTDGGITERLVQTIKQGGPVVAPDLLFNTFENVLFAPGAELQVYRDHIRKIGVDNVHLAGSGPTLFTLVKDETAGMELCYRLKSQGLVVHLITTS